MFTAQDQETRSTVSARPAWNLRQHRTFLAAEGVLLALMVTLAVLARLHPGPFPGDLGLSLAWERLVRPDGTATAIVEFFGNATWPLQAMLIAIGIAIVFGLFRRWLDIIISLATAALASGTNLTIMQLVGRPRPAGPGLHVNGNVGFPSFPSGHVEHALAFYGIVLFLTFQMRYPHWWLWIVRVPLIVFIVMLAPSRLVTGEHWPSDVLAALIWGAIWLLLAIQVYRWAAQRWPRLVPDNERNAQGHDDTPITHAGRRPTLHTRPSGQITALIALMVVVVVLVAGNFLASLGTWVIDVIHMLSYVGVFALLLLENLFPPVPSEVILPLTGFLVGRGQLNFVFVLLAATAGSLMGALVFYGLGRWLEEERLEDLMDRYGWKRTAGGHRSTPHSGSHLGSPV